MICFAILRIRIYFVKDCSKRKMVRDNTGVFHSKLEAFFHNLTKSVIAANNSINRLLAILASEGVLSPLVQTTRCRVGRAKTLLNNTTPSNYTVIVTLNENGMLL